MSKITLRRAAAEAVRDGASITATAHRYDISRATLHRWLRAFNPDHPVASLRPRKTGPKGPRWTDEMLKQIKELIADHPDWWGKRRVASALRERGVTLSEATVSRMLVVARQQLGQARDSDAREQEVRLKRQVRTAMRRSEREAARAALWRDLLIPAQEPGLTAQERCRRIAQALASKGYRIQVEDLTSDLRAIADGYLESLGGRNTFSPAEEWLIDARNWLRVFKNPEAGALEQRLRLASGHPNIDHLRVGALNHLVRNYSPNTELGASHVLLESIDGEQ